MFQKDLRKIAISSKIGRSKREKRSEKMDSSSQEEEGKTKVTEVKTFPVPYALEKIKENFTIITKTPSKPSKEQIINQAFKFHSQGNIQEAAKYYQLFINQGGKDHRVFSNYGVILKNLGKLKEAEVATRKAIALNPDFANAHYNLGNILKDMGKLKDAELSFRKAIEINPELLHAYTTVSYTHLTLPTIYSV